MKPGSLTPSPHELGHLLLLGTVPERRPVCGPSYCTSSYQLHEDPQSKRAPGDQGLKYTHCSLPLSVVILTKNPLFHESLPMIPKKQTQTGHHPLERFWWGEGKLRLKNKEEGRGIRDVLESLPAELWFSHHWKMWELVRGVSTCSEL